MITKKDLANMEIENINFEEVEKAIDDSIKSFHGWYPWEEAIIIGEYSIEIRNIIGKKYKNAGWKHVYHRTSSENGERAGLTDFKFSNVPLEDEHTKNKFIEVM